MKARYIYFTAALLGLIAVVAGALGAHALKTSLSPEQMGSFETAVRFQMYHALALLIVGALADKYQHKLLSRAALLILVGVICFSGSIYLLVLSPLKPGIVTPIGGLILMFGWGLIGYWGLTKRK